MKRLVIVTDMLNDFMDAQGTLFCGPDSRKIIEPMQERIETARRNGWPVVYVSDAHDEDDEEFNRYPPHAVAGTWGAEVIPELEVRDEDYRVRKQRYDAFFETEMEDILKREQPDEVELMGVCTSICVMFTAEELCSRDIPVKMPRDCVADFDEEAHAFALKHMEKVLGVQYE
jgi:nicotinamidase-related amidase